MKTLFRTLLPLCLLAGFLVPTQSGQLQAQQPLDIQINFTGDQSFLPLFQNAETFWETLLPSYKDGGQSPGNGNGPQNPISPVLINAGVFSIDGAGDTLAQASTSLNTFTDDSGFVLSTAGFLEFDSDDIGSFSNQQLQEIIVHEIGHTLGFGTRWVDNQVYNPATSSATSVGQYTGAKGVDVYNTEFGLNETFIPIENDGGQGTADSHFDEELFGIAINGDSTVASGLRFGPNNSDILTGFFNPNAPSTFSETTAATFHDIGFNVDFTAIENFNVQAVPEPSGTSIFLASLVMLSCRRRRNA